MLTCLLNDVIENSNLIYETVKYRTIQFSKVLFINHKGEGFVDPIKLTT